MWLHVCSRLIMILVLLQPSRTILDSSRSNLSTGETKINSQFENITMTATAVVIQ